MKTAPIRVKSGRRKPSERPALFAKPTECPTLFSLGPRRAHAGDPLLYAAINGIYQLALLHDRLPVTGTFSTSLTNTWLAHH